MSRGLRLLAGAAAIVAAPFTGGLSTFFYSAGASLVLGAVFEQRPPSFQRNNGQNVMARSGTEPQPIIYGRAKKSGPLLWFGTSGDRRQYLWYAVTVSDYREIDGYETLWIDGKAVDIATQFDVDGFCTHPDFIDSDGNKLVKAKFYRGAAGQVADAELIASTPFMDSAAVGANTAYFWVRFETDRSAGGNDPDNSTANVWSLGAPRNLQVTVRGFRVYDPRKDSTNGGTGAHRLADPSTWEWSANPSLCMRDWLADDYLGPGFRLSLLPTDHYAAQANICDELVTVPDGIGGTTTQPRYTINGFELIDSEDLTPHLRSMMTSCHGTYVQFQGKHMVTVGAWKTPDNDIDETWLADGYVLEPSATGEDLYNVVSGTHPDARKDYVLVDYPSRESAAYITADGGRRWPRPHDLVWTTDTYEAQRIALTKLKLGRNQGVIRLECNRKAMLLAPYDTVRLSINALGWALKTFRVMHMSIGANGLIEVTLREEQATDWDFTLPEVDEVSYGDPIAREASRPPAITGLTASSAPEGIRLEWITPGGLVDGRTELYASATNDRSAATLVARETSETIVLPYPASTVRYFWGFNRGTNNLLSPWHPTGALDGVMGTAGAAGQGLPGDPGDPAIDGFVAVDGPAAWVRDQDGSTWNPVATTTDIDWTFELAGVALARISRRVTRDSAGLLTVSTVAHPAGDLNTTRVTITLTGDGTKAVTLLAKYDHEGKVKAAAQTVTSALSGADGAAGLSVAEVYTYRRSASAPATPTGGSYSFTTQTLTPPSGWSAGVPAGTDPVYVSVSSASITGTTGADNSLTWSAPVKVFEDGADGINGADGSGVDIIFRRSATQPATPTPSAGTPATWYTDVNSVPASADPLWSSVGQRPDSTSNYVWGTPARIEGIDGDDGAAGFNTATLTAYIRSASTPVTNPGTLTYTFATAGWTPLNGWSKTVPAGSDPVWAVAATAYANAATDSVAAGDWSAPVQVFANGTAGDSGLNVATVYIYQRTTADSAPTKPSVNSTYTFATGGITGLNNGWTATVPAFSGSNPYLWVTTATASNTSATDVIAGSEWATPQKLAQNGEDGAAGLSVAELIIYRRAASAPVTPTGGSYNFGTHVLTPPTNWTSSIPAGTDPAYTSRAVAAVQGTSGTDNTLTWTTPALTFQDGSDGADGQAVDMVFKRSAAQPATPSPSAGVPATWYTDVNSVPAGADPLWSSVGTRPDPASNWTWQTPIRVEGQDGQDGQDGTNGTNGLNAATLTAFKRSASAPVDNPGTLTYTFATAGWTPANGWSKTVPDGLNPVWAVSASAVSNTATDSVGSAEWSTPTQVYSDGDGGVDGLNVATVYLFQRTATSAAPTLPSASITYVFATGVATNINNGWTQTLPTTGGAYRWMTTATASIDAPSDVITAGEWSTPAILAEDGINALSVSVTPASKTIAADSAGVIKSGQLPFSFAITAFAGSTDVTLLASYSTTAFSGLSATFGASLGQYNINTVTLDEAFIEITVTYAGAQQKVRVTVSKARDGSTASSAIDTSISNVAATTYDGTVHGGPLDVGVGPLGTITASFNGTYIRTVNSGSVQIEGKFQYREKNVDPGWTDMGAVSTGTLALWMVDVWDPKGNISFSRSIAGPATLKLYEFRLLLRVVGGTVTGMFTVPGVPNFTVSWSP